MKTTTYLALIVCIIAACNSTDSNGNRPIMLDNSLYEAAPRDDFEFISAEIKDNNLVLQVRYSGGCSHVEWQLIGHEGVAESNPPQRVIRLSFDSNNDCDNTKIATISFNLIPSRAEKPIDSC